MVGITFDPMGKS